MLPHQQFCLRWKFHHSNLQSMFSQLLDRGCFCDVTLACNGQSLKAHRVVLSACSTYFDSILSHCNSENPIIILKDVNYDDMSNLIDFMYHGEINVLQSNLASLLKTAEELRIKGQFIYILKFCMRNIKQLILSGLAEVSWRDDGIENSENHNSAESVQSNDHLSTNHTDRRENKENMLKALPFLAPLSLQKKKRGRPTLEEPRFVKT